MTCAECAAAVGGDWFRHACFAAAPRNVWLTPLAAPASLAGEDAFGSAPLALATTVRGVRVQRLWDERRGSFKDAPVEAAAAVGLALGFRRFAIPSCGSAARALDRWAVRHGVEAELWLPSAAGPLAATAGTCRVVAGGWAETYRRFWQRCRREDGPYPLFPAGDPWFLAALRRQARAVLSAGHDVVVVPCGSGVHLLALLEEAEALASPTEVVGVQLAGNDPLVRAWRSRPPRRAPPARCAVTSMWSQRPVNLARIVATARRTGRCRMATVPTGALARAEAVHGPQLAARGWEVDASLFAALALCAQPEVAGRERVCVLSTAGSVGAATASRRR